MNALLLGKEVTYKNTYDNTLLYPIKRTIGRNKLGLAIDQPLPFNGYDLWNCYELSWLDALGKPVVRIMEFIVPANSEYLIESKSIKLYLNSFNNTKFSSEHEVYALIKNDLSKASGAGVEIFINKLEHYKNLPLSLFNAISIDENEVEITEYNTNADLLKDSQQSDEILKEALCSNLFKSNCLVTGQPDWASIFIEYRGRKINHHNLLKYLISYRDHNGFHEECIERIFIDLMNICQPSMLTVFAKYTRRGGVDINPLRTNQDLKTTIINKTRDVRQ